MMTAAGKLKRRAYRVVLADFPWKFRTWSKKGLKKSAERHYKTMTLDEMVALKDKIGFDAAIADDCVLVMWTTFPLIVTGAPLALMKAWGFTGKTGGAWAKVGENGKLAFGPGYIYRGAAELWLLGTRGAPKVKSHSVRNLILAPRHPQHSRKPDQMHDDIERLFDGPYLELFARRPRARWDCWGDQIN